MSTTSGAVADQSHWKFVFVTDASGILPLGIPHQGVIHSCDIGVGRASTEHLPIPTLDPHRRDAERGMTEVRS